MSGSSLLSRCSFEPFVDSPACLAKVLLLAIEFSLRFKAHSKTPLECLHLETGTVLIRFILASRRANYPHNTLSQPKDELIRRVYKAQNRNKFKKSVNKKVKAALTHQNDLKNSHSKVRDLESLEPQEYIKRGELTND